MEGRYLSGLFVALTKQRCVLALEDANSAFYQPGLSQVGSTPSLEDNNAGIGPKRIAHPRTTRQETNPGDKPFQLR